MHKKGESKCVSLGPPKMWWPSGDAVFQNQDKKYLTHIVMMSHLIPYTFQLYRPKLHQSVVLQALKVRA